MNMRQLHCTPLSSLSVTDTPCMLIPRPRYLRLIAPDIPFENRRRIDIARAVVKEATFAIIDAQRGAAFSSTSPAVAAANTSSSTSSAGAAAAASAPPGDGPSSRRSSRSKSSTAAWQPTRRKTKEKPVDDRIPLQIVNEASGASTRAINNPLRPKYHDVDLPQLDEAALAFKRTVGTTPMDKMRLQVPPAYCAAKNVPYGYLSLGAIRRSSGVPPATPHQLARTSPAPSSSMVPSLEQRHPARNARSRLSTFVAWPFVSMSVRSRAGGDEESIVGASAEHSRAEKDLAADGLTEWRRRKMRRARSIKTTAVRG